MSLVSAFVAAAASSAMPMIGKEPLIIGDTTLQCVLSEVDFSKEFAEGGFEPTKRLIAVCLTSDLPASSILKKSATARGESFRVEGLSTGGSFTTITLEEIQKA